ncbi:hypothetical protein B0H14DRAFT_2641903 [Mycena olivaceomarginata]|nr:hypothetical protein B0H14DRAFT_2641903 [Mycena olivaceomarginata]
MVQPFRAGGQSMFFMVTTPPSRSAHVFIITKLPQEEGIPALDVWSTKNVKLTDFFSSAAIGSESFKETFDVMSLAPSPSLTTLSSINAYGKGTAPLLQVPAYSAGKVALNCNSLTAQWDTPGEREKSGIRVASICSARRKVARLCLRLGGLRWGPRRLRRGGGGGGGVKASLERRWVEVGGTGVFFNKDEDLDGRNFLYSCVLHKIELNETRMPIPGKFSFYHGAIVT